MPLHIAALRFLEMPQTGGQETSTRITDSHCLYVIALFNQLNWEHCFVLVEGAIGGMKNLDVQPSLWARLA